MEDCSMLDVVYGRLGDNDQMWLLIKGNTEWFVMMRNLVLQLVDGVLALAW